VWYNLIEVDDMARRLTTKLTARQRELLEFVEQFITEEGYPPTVAEIGGAMGIRSKNGVNEHLLALQRKGYLTRSSRARSIRLIRSGSGRHMQPSAQVPLLGRVAAGEPVISEQYVEGYMPVEPELAEGTSFALKVEGESMIDDGILPGDVVIVRNGAVPRDGDVVVALVDNETTIKRFYRRDSSIELRPANRTMQPINVAADRVTIQGVVLALHRRF